MKISVKVLILILIITIPCKAQKKEVEAIKSVFNNYRSAILNDKGDEAVKYVDSRTIQYYSDILEKTRTADSATTNSLSVLDKIMVFSIRARSTKDEIKSLNGETLLVYAIKKGMVGKNSVMNVSLGEVTVDENFAKGQVISNKQKSPLYFHFYKESNQWKIDLTSLFQIANMSFKKVIEESGQSENEFLLMLLEMTTGSKPGKEIWEPSNN